MIPCSWCKVLPGIKGGSGNATTVYLMSAQTRPSRKESKVPKLKSSLLLSNLYTVIDGQWIAFGGGLRGNPSLSRKGKYSSPFFFLHTLLYWCIAENHSLKYIAIFLESEKEKYSFQIWFRDGLWTPNEGISQRNLKIWADVADKICLSRT